MNNSVLGVELTDRCTLLLGVVAVITVWLYLPAAGGPQLLDDRHVIGPLLEAGAQAEPWQAHLLSPTGPLGRPLSMASFVLNAKLNGDDLRAWKYTNLAIHIAIGLVLYLLFLDLGRVTGAPRSSAKIAALSGAALWMLHPLHVSTVMYTVQRMTQLAALFSVLGMLCYVRARSDHIARRSGRIKLLAAFFLFTPLAALCKETGALLPLFLACIELTVFAAVAAPKTRALRISLALGFAVPAIVMALWLAVDFEGRVLAGYGWRDFTFTERVLTEPRILLMYLTWIVAPNRMTMGFYHDDIAVSQALLGEARTLLAIVAVVALAVAAAALRKRAPLVALGLALFFAGHALESTIFALELAFEHRNYLPSVGIILALLGIGLGVRGVRRAVTAAGLVVVTGFALLTGSRAQIWGDPQALYMAFYRAHPQSTRATVTLAEWYTVATDYDQALAVLGGAETDASELQRLRILCARDAHPGPRAMSVLHRLNRQPRISLYAADAMAWLAGQAVDGNCAFDAAEFATVIDAAEARISQRPKRYRLLVYGAHLRWRAAQPAAALETLVAAAAHAPSDPLPWYLAAEWSVDRGRPADAAAYLERARRRGRVARRDFSAMDATVQAMLEANAGDTPR